MTRHRHAVASILAALLVGALLSVASPAQAADMDCGDFATQADAQAFFMANGGPAQDPHLLDAEGDGLACESLPCPCSEPPPPPPPPATCSRNTVIKEAAVVLSVVDGDTLNVRINGTRQVVRLLGINSPERGRKGYVSATQALRKLTPATKRVTLTSDPTQAYTDQHGRILRYVTRGSTDVNRTQLSQGWARYFEVQTCAPLTKKAAYRSAERAAKKAHRGIWK